MDVTWHAAAASRLWMERLSGGGGCEASRSAELAEEKDSGPAEHGERLPHLLCVVLANSDILTANYGVK